MYGFLAGAEDVVFVLITQGKLHLAWIELGWDTWPLENSRCYKDLFKLHKFGPPTVEEIYVGPSLIDHHSGRIQSWW